MCRLGGISAGRVSDTGLPCRAHEGLRGPCNNDSLFSKLLKVGKDPSGTMCGWRGGTWTAAQRLGRKGSATVSCL